MKKPGIGLLLCELVALGAALIAPASSAVAAAPTPDPAAGDGSSRIAVHDPARIAAGIDATVLDVSRAVVAGGLQIDTGLGVLEIEEGTLYSAAPAAGRVAEMVFLGKARLRLDAPDDVEAGQLELFTGRRSLDEPITEAILAVCLEPAVNRILSRPRVERVDPESWERAQRLFGDWKDSPERKLLRVEAGVLLGAAGDPYASGYFAGRFHSESLGNFFLLVQPDTEEQVTVGQFVPLGGTAEEQRKRRRYLHRQQTRGRLIGIELDDLGMWNTWMSGQLRDETGAAYPGFSAFEPSHYTMDVTIDEKRQRLSGTSRLKLRPVTDGRRVVRLEAHNDVRIESVHGPGGEELFFFTESGLAARNEVATHVFLKRAPARGETFEIEVKFGGPLLERVRIGVFRLRETMSWYPHAGAVDRATYDVTLRWPRALELVGSGSVVQRGKDGKQRWQRRVLDVPATAFSFEVGDFKMRYLRAGKIDVTVAFDRIAGRAPGDNHNQVLRTIRDCLAFYEEAFGPYPLDELTVVTVPREFSQGLLGFISLASPLLYDHEYAFWLGIEDRRTVIAHEVAHQWWGNLVGWDSYRDEWISEAMANYAAMVWARNRLPRGKRPRVGPADQWQQALFHTAENGRSVESLGPLVLGRRLRSTRSLDAYESIVYKKGAVVLNMLNYVFGEGSFLGILRGVVQRRSGQLISTEDFLADVEEASGVDLDWFAQQYVYGTGLPEVYYSYEFQRKDNGKWSLKGEVRQRTPYHYTYSVVPAANGFDVRREALGEIDVSRSSLVVPVQIAVYDPERARGFAGNRKKRASQAPANSTIVGRLLQRGERYEFEAEIDYEPRRMWLDRDAVVFGRFFSEHESPKRTMMYRAFDLGARGRSAESRDLFLDALDADSTPQIGEGNPVDAFLYEWESRYLDATIHSNLAWLYMDEGRLDEAADEMRRARRVPDFTLRRIEGGLKILESRLDILEGDPARAVKRLQRLLFQTREVARTDAYVLLAIAAHAAGDRSTLKTAVKFASKRGVDLSALGAP